MKKTRATLAMLFAASTVLALQASPANAAADVTAPVIKTNAAAGFLVGGVIGDSVGIDDWDGYTWGTPELVKATVSDNSGKICHFEIYAMAADSWPDVEYGQLILAMHSNGTTSPYAAQVVDGFSDYDGAQGSSGDRDSGWKMVATDCSGNTSSVEVRAEIGVLQEDNRHATYDYPHVLGSLSYSGSWSSTACACASWDAMRRTSSKGASFTFTRTYERDDHVGLVMAKGPGRGQADVFVDGVKTATINTYAQANSNRVIVYDKWMPAGVHTVKVVNKATAGHPRIDLDAVLAN